MNIHKIHSHLHQSFLEEERKDAITGDLIQANDEVVFCGMCKSVFLKDSWEFIGKKHCGQLKTLKNVPISVPLLLNVSKIKPHFITLINSSISYEECLKMLSDFNPRDKKVEVLLNPNLKKVLEKSVEKPKPQLRYISTNEQELPKEESSNSSIMALSLILGLGVSFFPALGINSFWFRILFIFSIILSFYLAFTSLLFLRKRRNKISTQKIVSLENPKIEKQKGQPKVQDPASFGIFNHSLFFYFEQIQQGIFVELTRISEIEIQYQSNCCLNLILKKHDESNKEITIPLLFSKQERITTFLLRLSKTKKDVSNHSMIKLTNFPIERIRLLKKKLMLYTDILFVEPEKIEPKNDFVFSKTKSENDSISIKELIQPRDLDRLVKSQKVSRQSQNRNQHYQNQHQTQYKNYKRK